jgi:pimeloyl-ACP methyl ester carboxylesterase
MHTLRVGSGSPPLVFVHGFTCSHSDWAPQIAHFSPRHEVVAVDLRGHGATPGTPAEVSIETFGADVVALLEEWNLNGALLIGHSMGCRVVLQAALDAPSRVAGVVLVDGGMIGIGDPDAIERDVGAAVRAMGFKTLAANMFGAMFSERTDPQLKAAILARVAAFPPAIGEALFPRTNAWDARTLKRALTTIKAPLLLLQSTTLTPDRKRTSLRVGESSDYLDFVRSLRPDARIEIIEGAGHFTGLDAPEAVNRAIEGLIARL